MNPAVSLAFALRGDLPAREALAYVGAQVCGALAGVCAAHAMFDLPVMQVSQHLREGPAQIFSEVVATFGLLLTIFGCVAKSSAAGETTPTATPVAVGLYIVAAYWFTASTSFANPAVTLARAFTDTFAGIAPHNVGAFIGAQIAGALAALAISPVLWPRENLSR